jgi:putative colanic acid biosysnthesis UDP-glucose lipid carrier transferase
MQLYRNKTFFLRMLVDLGILNAAYIFTALLVQQFKSVSFSPDSLYILIILNFVWYYTARGFELYDEFRTRAFSIETVAIMKGTLVQFLSLVALLFLFREMSLSRYFAVGYTIILSCGIVAGRFAVRKMLIYLRKHGRNLRTMLIVGAQNTGLEFNEELQENPHFGYNVLGFIDDHPQPKLNGQYLGKLKDLRTILVCRRVDEVVVTLPAESRDAIQDVIKTCDDYLARVKILPDYYPLLTNNFSISRFSRFPMISVRDIDLDLIQYRFLKRSFDVFFTLAAFILIFSWLWPLIAIAIKLCSPGPVFFKQERWGRDNKKIICYKFRSMVADCIDLDDKGKYRQAVKDDPRVTRFGKLLRKTNLDELPQFWNVLKGEMSIVGPRPHPTPLNLESRNVIDHYMIRHLVKPGITGWAQVRGYRGSTKNRRLMRKRVEHDISYIENWSFWLDIQIILMTVLRMVQGDDNAY